MKLLQRLWPKNRSLQAAKPQLSGWLIRPEAERNWLSPSVRWYTPDKIESITAQALAGNLVAQWELFDLMERTWPRLAKNLRQLRDRAIHVGWSVQPWTRRGQPPAPEATERAAAIDDAIWSMRPAPDRDELDWPGLLFALSDAWAKGISVVELDWEIRTIGGRKLWTPRAARHLTPHHYAWHEGRLWLRQTDPVGRELLTPFEPPDKWIIGLCRHKSGPPTGAALLAPLAWFWSAANFAWEWWLNYAQLFGVPIRVANYDVNAGPDVRAMIERALADMGSAGWIALPSGTALQLVESVKANAANPQVALVEAVDKLCDLMILGQTLTSDVGDSGSYAAAKVHGKVLSDREQALAQWLSATLQQLARAFCRLNWGDDAECPWFAPNIEEPQDAEAMARRDEILLRAGLPIPKQWLYERHGIPAPGPDDETIGGASPDATAALLGRAPIAAARRAGRRTSADLDRIVRLALPRALRAQQDLARRIAQIIDQAAGPDEALQKLQETFQDWDPTDLAVALEQAMQIAAAEGIDIFASDRR